MIIQGSSQKMADFSRETFQARREWVDIFKILKERNCEPNMLLLVKLFLRSFPKQKLREFITIRYALQEMLKGVC